jgi:hypothetical protein
MLRRYLTLLSFALWMGGFTFYTLVVIPTGSKVLGGEREVGFITQQATNWLNWIGIPALLMFGWNLRAQGGGIWRVLLLLAWLAMAAAEVGVFLIHHVIDGMLDTSTHKIHNFEHFYGWHRFYMVTASFQWLAALAYLWIALVIWRDTDRQRPV